MYAEIKLNKFFNKMTQRTFKIAHLSSVHPRYDTRIFLKLCKSLVKQNYKVFFIVADGKGNEFKNKISIVDIGILSSGRFSRMTKTVNRIFEKGLELDCDLYHLHDPELIPIGLKLKKLGKKVIFDVHENIAFQILDKNYIPRFLRKLIAIIFRIYEINSLKKFDALILAENSYLKNYISLNKRIEIILNLPDHKLLKNFQKTTRNKMEIFHIGNITNARGFDKIINALKILKKKIPNFFLHYVGNYTEELINSVDLNDINKNIKFYGPKSLLDGLEYSKNSIVGISILKPLKNYQTSYSTKVFEYMAIGLPVITSNFKIYKDIIEKYDCGICVDPNNPKEIANALEIVMKNPSKAMRMGLNGIKAINEKFKWELEEKKLLRLYESLFN
jgi:glycosyltransferase involved in cell wall biosynthesis